MYLIALMEVMKRFVNPLALTKRNTGNHFHLSLAQAKLISTLGFILVPLKTLMSLQRPLEQKSKSISNGGTTESPLEIYTRARRY
jgi:hypothetical protein